MVSLQSLPRSTVLALALLTLGCPKQPGPPDAQVEPAADAFVRALCGYYARCEGTIGRVFESSDACNAHWSKAVTCDATISLASAEAMRACATRLEETIDCAYDTDDPTSPCVDVYLGPALSQAQEPCVEGLCNFDSFCRYSQVPQGCPVCVKYAAVGEMCVLMGGSPDYRPCDPTQGYCNNGQCSPKKDLNFTCTANEQCALGVCRNGMCGQPLPLGSPCAAGDVCAGRFRLCFNGICSDRHVPGATCDRDQHCLPTDECDNGVCHRFAVCSKRQAGELCSVPGQCADGYYCGPSTGGLHCLPVVAPGGSCISSAEACGPNGFCQIQTTQCAGRVPVDGGCPGTGCVQGAYCNSQKACQALKAIGATCEQFWECESQLCDGMPKTCIDGRVCTLPDGGSYHGRDGG
jgi:hypothetical protein